MKRLKLTLGTWPVVLTATFLICYLTMAVGRWFGVELDQQVSLKPLKEMLLMAFREGTNLPKALGNLFLILVFAPIFEEVLFRWLLFRWPTRRFRLGSFGTAMIAIISSVLFSGAHYFNLKFPDNAFVALWFFGLVQCWLYRRTERLWCPVLNHFLFNLTNLLLLFLVDT